MSLLVKLPSNYVFTIWVSKVAWGISTSGSLLPGCIVHPQGYSCALVSWEGNLRSDLSRMLWELMAKALLCPAIILTLKGGKEKIRRHFSSASLSLLHGEEGYPPSCHTVCQAVMDKRALLSHCGSHTMSWGFCTLFPSLAFNILKREMENYREFALKAS